MNKIETWIDKNKTKRETSWNWRIDGYYIEDILPNTYEAYAIIYHPFKLPLGSLITGEENERKEAKQFSLKVNKIIANNFKIPIDELPNVKYDIEDTIREKVNREVISEHHLDAKLKELENQILKIAFQPLQNIVDNIDSKEDDAIERREGKWEEVFKFYKLEFNEKSSWYDTLSLSSNSKIYNSVMPEQDRIPGSILKSLHNFLAKKGIQKANINSLSNTIGLQHLINKDSEDVSLGDIVNYENVHILNSISNDWIFINPYDYCRTIVASSKEFINELKNETSLEISDFVNSKHRFNKMYTDNNR